MKWRCKELIISVFYFGNIIKKYNNICFLNKKRKEWSLVKLELDVKEIIKIIENHLYSYLWIDKKIIEIKNKYSLDERDVNSWIKSKGRITRITEIQALANIETSEEMEKELKWYYMIKKVLRIYETKDEQEKINYIKFKYFEKCSTTKIEMKMAISRPTQARIKADIIYYLAMFAVKEKLINI